MAGITTHVLDTSRGRPAAGVEVTLERRGEEGQWREVARRRTDGDGRVGRLLPEEEALRTADYRLRFAVGDYFAERDEETFYPYAEVVFAVRNPEQHYHVPLLLSPFGYATYRGS